MTAPSWLLADFSQEMEREFGDAGRHFQLRAVPTTRQDLQTAARHRVVQPGRGVRRDQRVELTVDKEQWRDDTRGVVPRGGLLCEHHPYEAQQPARVASA